MLYILWTVILGYIVYTMVNFRRSYLQKKKISDKVTPIGPNHPIMGSVLLYSNTDEYIDLAMDLVQKTKTKMYVVWVFFLYPTYIACHPDTANVILRTSEPKTRYHRGGIHRMLLPWLGDGLLTSDGPKWARNRRLLTPAFHFDILKPYVHVYNQVTDIFLENVSKGMAKDDFVEIYHLVSLATLDTMLRCALSYEDGVQVKGAEHPYVEAVKQLSALFCERIVSPWYFFDFVYSLSSSGRKYKKICDYVHNFADKIIAKRKKALEEDSSLLKKKRLDFLDILLTAKDEFGVGLSDADIRAEVDTFMFEGHDTTASAISWAIYSLGKYPEEQDKLYNEINGVLGDRAIVNWDDIPKFKYLQLFIKEVLRMYSPVAYISRWLTKPLQFEEVTIPANTTLDINIFAMNHHPDVWPDHEKFRPERFEEESFLKRDAYSYVPFSAGPRNCIGQNFALNEQKVMLARLIQRFKVQLVEGHEYKASQELVVRAKYGIKVKMEERMM